MNEVPPFTSDDPAFAGEDEVRVRGSAGGVRTLADLSFSMGGSDLTCGDVVRGQCSKENLHKRVPITKWLPHYGFKDAQSDIIAGFTVALTVIPQGLAYASIAQLPLQYGLYAGFMGCFMYCIFGTSKDITLGPTAIMSLLVGSYSINKDPAYAVMLTFLAGWIQLAMGIFNLGFVVNFLSHPVLSGFVSAAAIIIAFGQVKNILGLDFDAEGFIEQIHQTFSHIKETNLWDLILGVICLLVMLILKKLKDMKFFEEDSELPVCKKIVKKVIWLSGTARNAIVVLITATLAYCLHQLASQRPFTLTDRVEPGLPHFKLPNFTTTVGNQTVTTPELLSNLGAGIAVVPFIAILESIVIGKAFAKQNKYKLDPTQEMIAIGLSNIAGSFVSSYPITGSFSRTAVNSQSGVRTPASGIVTGSLVLLALGVLASSFTYIPKSALAAVIIAAVLPMVDLHIVTHLWRIKRSDLLPLVVTFLSCLFISIEYGILIGIGLSVCFLLYPLARPGVIIAQRDLVVIKPQSGMYFPAVEYIKDKVSSRAFECEVPKSVIVDCSHISGIDSTAIEGIEHLVHEAKQLDKVIVFSNLRTHVLETLQSAHIPGGLQYCPTLEEAVTLVAGECCVPGGAEPAATLAAVVDELAAEVEETSDVGFAVDATAAARHRRHTDLTTSAKYYANGDSLQIRLPGGGEDMSGKTQRSVTINNNAITECSNCDRVHFDTLEEAAAWNAQQHLLYREEDDAWQDDDPTQPLLTHTPSSYQAFV